MFVLQSSVSVMIKTHQVYSLLVFLYSKTNNLELPNFMFPIVLEMIFGF